MTLNGTGGANQNTLNSMASPAYTDPTTGETSGSFGVIVFSPQTSQTTTVASAGALSITGQAGASPTTGMGIVIGGPYNMGVVDVSSSAAITLTGTGGGGNAEDTGELPNAGVGIFNPGNNLGSASVTAAGSLTITGTAGTGGGVGIEMSPYFGPGSSDVEANDGLIDAGGEISITSTAGKIDYLTTSYAPTVFFQSPTGTSSSIEYDDLGRRPFPSAAGIPAWSNISTGHLWHSQCDRSRCHRSRPEPPPP